jgi:hypothetical protein
MRRCDSRRSRAEVEELEPRTNVPVLIAVVTLMIAVVFVLYAWSGADLCVWCGALGR